jgi:hypothetical protein
MSVLPSFYLVCFGGTSSLLRSSRWVNLRRGMILRKGLLYTPVVQDARSCFRTMGFFFKRTEKSFLDFLTLVDEG